MPILRQAICFLFLAFSLGDCDRMEDIYLGSEVKTLVSIHSSFSACYENSSNHLGSKNVCSLRQDQFTREAIFARTCLELLSLDPNTTSDYYWIDPDGPRNGMGPIYVYCDISSGMASSPSIRKQQMN